MANGTNGNSPIDSVKIPKPRAPFVQQNDVLQDVSVFRSLQAVVTTLSAAPPVTDISTSATFTNGIVMQWVVGPTDSDAAEHTHVVTWPTPFTKVVFTIQVTTTRPNEADSHPDDIFEYQVVSWTLTDVTIYRARRGDDNPVTTASLILGVGF